MNLADALRRVNSDGQPLPTPKPAREQVAEAPKKSAPQEKITKTSPKINEADPEVTPEPWHPNVSGNVVRLELFLSAEQMAGLFRAIMAGQHTILTVREAAAYLRISQDSLVKLAEEGEIPGVHIEGRWRFPKPNLDDWLMMQSVNSEDSQEVA